MRTFRNETSSEERFSLPEDAPLWVRDFQKWIKLKKDYYWGRGSERGYDEASFRAAYNRALGELSNYATMEFFVVLEEVVRYQGVRRIDVSKSKVESIFTSALIKEEQVVDVYRCPCGVLFVLVGVKKNSLKERAQSDLVDVLKNLPQDLRINFVRRYYSQSQ